LTKFAEFWTIGFGKADFTVLKDMAKEFGSKGKFSNIISGEHLKESYTELAYVLPV
jgi:hypothetical protein